MRIEFLYFEGCPAHEEYLPRLRELLARIAQGEELQLRCIESVDDAVAERFLGSPTVRINGVDVDPGAADRSDYGLKCRLYAGGGKLVSAPADELVISAVRAAAAG